MDSYIYFLEILKHKIKQPRNFLEKKDDHRIVTKSFFKAIEYNRMLDCGKWSKASQAMLKFVKSQNMDLINQDMQIQLDIFKSFECAVYLAFLVIFGKTYTPDYVLYFLDSKKDLSAFYEAEKLQILNL